MFVLNKNWKPIHIDFYKNNVDVKFYLRNTLYNILLKFLKKYGKNSVSVMIVNIKLIAFDILNIRVFFKNEK